MKHAYYTGALLCLGFMVFNFALKNIYGLVFNGFYMLGCLLLLLYHKNKEK